MSKSLREGPDPEWVSRSLLLFNSRNQPPPSAPFRCLQGKRGDGEPLHLLAAYPGWRPRTLLPWQRSRAPPPGKQSPPKVAKCYRREGQVRGNCGVLHVDVNRVKRLARRTDGLVNQHGARRPAVLTHETSHLVQDAISPESVRLALRTLVRKRKGAGLWASGLEHSQGCDP